MAETALVKSETTPPMSLEEVKGQVHLIQEVMRGVMKKDEHYGVIPGTDKPTLLKPGAEKLCLTFRFDPEYEIVRATETDDYVSYTIACSLYKIGMGHKIASGLGACNSSEAKYRYRWEDTGRRVPKEYWDNRDQSLLGTDGIYKAKKRKGERKEDGAWIIQKRVENTNPRDLANTLLKMACKRALVAAVLNGTAASDIFTQDLEDTNGGRVEAESTVVDDPPDSKPPFLDRLQNVKAMLQVICGEDDGAEVYWKAIHSVDDSWSTGEEIPPNKQGKVLNTLRKALEDAKKQYAQEETQENGKERKDTLSFLIERLEQPFPPGAIPALLRLQGDHIDWLKPDGGIYAHRGDVEKDLYEHDPRIMVVVEGERGKKGVKYALQLPKE